MLRGLEIGLTKGAGFARTERMESKEEWVSAAEAIQLLKPVVKAAYVAQKTICARAHNGLIRSRAERFMVDNRVADGHENVRGTVFHVGRFDEWSVVVAECGEGNVYAAATVDRGINHFHAEVALFVGVAGGVKDVSIGDALVSCKVYGYERGKDTEDGFKPRPVAHLPAYTLEQRARAIKLTAWCEAFPTCSTVRQTLTRRVHNSKRPTSPVLWRSRC